MAMIHAICRACHWTTVVADQLPDSCERCESPFFYYRRITYEYVLTDADRAFLRSGGIAPEDAVTPQSD
jgi:hypothetical protein